jgi:hypothetical protein
MWLIMISQLVNGLENNLNMQLENHINVLQTYKPHTDNPMRCVFLVFDNLRNF